MRIASSAVALQSHHVSATRSQESETLRAWIGSERPDFEDARRGRPTAMPPPPPPPPDVSGGTSSQADAIQQASDAAANDPIVTLIRAMLEWMTGETLRVFDARQLHADAPPPVQDPAAAPAASAPRSAGFGIEYDYHAVREESERTDISAQGTIRTADGRDIAFRLDLSMARYYREEVGVSVRAGDGRRKDPLVINFDGTAAQLSSQRFRFDLDADGKAEDVPLLAGGSGYLALDLNHNGKIDSGAELFGPASDSGFADLAKHDSDRNGWIEENDPAFGQLRVWKPAADGGSLAPLAEHGVGALYLGYAGTPFALRGQDNQDLGAVRDTGVYLTEAGKAGSLQEIDLTV